MLYLVYAVLGVCCTRCQLLIMAWQEREGRLNFVFCDDGRLVDKKGTVGNEGKNDVKDISEYGKSEVHLACLGWEDVILLLLHTGSEVKPAL